MKPSELPRNVRMLAAILFVVIWVRGYGNAVPPGIPLLEMPDLLLDEDLMRPLQKWIVYAGMLLFVIGRWPRIGCLLAGTSMVSQVLLGMEFFSNGRLFAGLLLILIGLHRNERGLLYLRAQVLLLYLGAFLSKAIDPDWWNGQALTAVMQFHEPAARLADQAWLTTSSGWLTVAVEGSLFLLLLVPATRWIACLLCLGFHTTLAVLLSEDFSIFFYAVAGSMLLFLEIPKPVEARSPGWLVVASRYGLFDAREFERTPSGPARLRFADRAFEGYRALWIVLAFSPLGLLLPVALANALAVEGAFVLRSVALVAFAILLGAAILWTLAPARWTRAERVTSELGDREARFRAAAG